jgi:hypothetical protein
LFDNLQFLKLELTFWIYPTTICSGLVANQPQFSKHRERLRNKNRRGRETEIPRPTQKQLP